MLNNEHQSLLHQLVTMPGCAALAHVSTQTSLYLITRWQTAERAI